MPDVDPRVRPELIDEITTYGEQGYSDPGPGSTAPPNYQFPGSIGGTGGAPSDPGEAFLPPVVPQPITEIVVRAARPLPPAPTIGPSLLGRFSLPGFFALIGGVTLVKILDDLGQAKLDRALRESEPIVKPQRDTRLQTISVPAMFEIVVKGVRALQLPPLPTFISWDADPFEMISIPPAFLNPAPAPAVSAPAPLEIPAPAVRPFELPLPLRAPFPAPFGVPLPFAVPLPLTSPEVRPLPLAQPSPLPFGQPLAQPFAQPFAQPRAVPDSRTIPRGIVSPFDSPLPLPFASPQPLPAPQLASPGTCPPCPRVKKKKKETRTSCYKKLVIEGINEDFDTSFNWNEIDCLTGREL